MLSICCLTANAQSVMNIHQTDGRNIYVNTQRIDSVTFIKEGEYNQAMEMTRRLDLFESVDKPIVFRGRTVLGFGDSITYGVYSPGYHRTDTSSYLYMLATELGASLVNKSVSGATLTYEEDSEYGCILNSILSTTQAGDIVWLAAGTNDYQHQRPLGEFGDTGKTTFYGALKLACDHIRKQFPDATVVFMTPIPFKSNHAKYNLPIRLDLYREAICRMAATYGFSVVDGSSLGISEDVGGYGHFMMDDQDGIHPTLEGHRVMARTLKGKLQ